MPTETAQRDVISVLTPDITIEFVGEETGCSPKGLVYRVTLKAAPGAALRPARQIAVEVLALDNFGGFDLHTHYLSSRGGTEKRKADLQGGNYPPGDNDMTFYVHVDPRNTVAERNDYNNRKTLHIGRCIG